MIFFPVGVIYIVLELLVKEAVELLFLEVVVLLELEEFEVDDLFETDEFIEVGLVERLDCTDLDLLTCCELFT